MKTGRWTRADKRQYRENMARLRAGKWKPSNKKLPPTLVRAPAIDLAAPLGVQFHAPWALWGVGTCLVWRRLARAISEAGMPLNLTLDLFNGQAHANSIAEVRDLLAQKVRPECYLGAFSTSGDSSQAARIREFTNRGTPLALATMIERDRIGPLTVSEANRVAQWWLPCQSNVEAFRRSGVQDHRLFKVRVPFSPDDPHLRLVGRKSAGPTHFYRIGVVDRRKDQEKTVRAFLRAFRPGEARLTIKTTITVVPLSTWYEEDGAGNGWSPATSAQDIKIINSVWSDAQLLELHSQGDVYLSLSHGEGWDLPAFDAVLSGNRMVYTASGGPQEFAAEGDLLVRTTRMTSCHPMYGWEPNAQWIDFEVEDIARQLRTAHEQPLPKRHRRSWSGFTATDVGALAKTLLNELVRPRRRPSIPNRPRQNALAIVSLFRQCPETVEEYRRRIASLQWPSRPYVICVEGDSTDSTPEMLDAWHNEDSNVHVLHHDLGTPLFGSTDNPERLRALSSVSNIGLDYLTKTLDVEYLLFLTSDLLYEPDLAERLRAVLEQQPRAGLVAPMVWRDAGRGDVFYDTWAFRKRATERDPCFDKNPPRQNVLKQLGTTPVQLESVGSVLFCRSAPIYAGVRFTHEDVLGFSANMRAAGYSIWVDPTTHVHHPQEIHPQNIREPATKKNLRKAEL